MDNKYELRVENATMTVRGGDEWIAIMNTGLFESADMIECANSVDQIWLYTVKLNKRHTIAYIKRIS